MRTALLILGLLAITACSSGSPTAQATTTSSGVTRQLPVVAVPGYTVSVFTQQDSRLAVTAPDSIAVDGQNVFIDYQNVTAKDCTDQSKNPAPSSTVVEYDMNGKILGHWSVPGHSDGMRIDPATHLIWTTSCEDGNPKFTTIDPTSGTVTPYTLPPTPHGGGYDDLYFLNGSTFIAASNPNLDSSGANTNPAIDKISIANGKITLTPVLMGNATAADLLNNNAPAGLTLTDPDSMSVDNKGQLVLVSQGDSDLIFVNAPGTPQQKVSRLAVGTQLDDTVWPTGPGRLLVVDAGGVTYWISGIFNSGDIYTQSPNDSGVDNFVATVAPATGFVTPIAIGFQKATGMVFVPNS
jgi:ABC-type molybdate transport system substrate-binding protein